MKKGSKILIICIVAVCVAVGGVYLFTNTFAQDTPESAYTQGISAGEDQATVNIDIN